MFVGLYRHSKFDPMYCVIEHYFNYRTCKKACNTELARGFYGTTVVNVLQEINKKDYIPRPVDRNFHKGITESRGARCYYGLGAAGVFGAKSCNLAISRRFI